MIALVIGHTGSRQGARSDTYNISEFEFNSTLARLIRQYWVASGYIGDLELVYRDCPYAELPSKVNALEPELVLSLHCNAFNTLASGTEVLYYHKSQRGKEHAEILQRHLVSALVLPNRGVKPRERRERGGLLLRHTAAPCVIAEPFFIDNDTDYKTAWRNLDKLVNAYVLGLREMTLLERR